MARQQRPDGMYSALDMPASAALHELESSSDGGAAARGLARKIAGELLDAKLTPLQTRAVLVRAWAIVQTTGEISRPRDQEPSQKK